jgi:hypothetical protein
MKRSLLVGATFSAAVLVVTTVVAPVASAASLRVCPTLGPGCPFTRIQDAINHAPNGATISIAPGRYQENLTIGGASPLSLVGGDPQSVVIDGNHTGSVLTVLPGHSVKLVGLSLTNGVAPVNPAVGGAAGGGIANFGGSVEVVNSRITNNTAPQGFGGGVFNTDVDGGGTLQLVSTLVSGNSAGAGGGVSTISLTAATSASIVNSTVEDNRATGSTPPGAPAGAGGVQNCGTLTMVNSPIRNNSASNGGGLTNCGNGGHSGTATLTNSPITGNHATGIGGVGPAAGSGGGASNGGTLKLVNSPVTNNAAVAAGGGIFNLAAGPLSPVSGTVTRINSPVTGNTGSPPQFAQCFGTSC